MSTRQRLFDAARAEFGLGGIGGATTRALAEHQAAGRVRADLDTAAFAEILTATLKGGVLRCGSGLSAFDREVWIARTVEFLTRSTLGGGAEPATWEAR